MVSHGEHKTFLDKFIEENRISFLSETKEIVSRLRSIGRVTGARYDYFKHNEGTPGDGVCALYDETNSNLRLYCIWYGTQLIIVGNGGPKPKSIRSLQSNPKLKETNYFMKWLSSEIERRKRDGDISFCNNFYDLTGDFEFEYEEYE